MEKVLKLYKYIDGVNDTPFPSEEKQVVTSSFRYDIKRMGGAPTISCTIMHELCLDKLWSDNVYAWFNGERFFIKQQPSSSYSNTDTRFNHEIELVSERIVLDNVYFYDVVDGSANHDKPVSNSSKFTFFGDIREFSERLNQSLKYSHIGYSVVVDRGISSDEKQISFEDQFFSNVLQEIYNTYNLPYYFSGKVIHIGYTSNVITQTFKYGQDESLLSINKQNANFKIVNRVTGVGSSDNIPYYYPNDYESKSEVEANGGTWINPQTNLMPPIYRESLGGERFYSAKNNTYIDPISGLYYEFSNPYIEGKPKEHIINFEDIKPTIKEATNASGDRIDMFLEFAYDLNDNDKTDEAGNYLHPYFFAKLKRFDGQFGFNLFEHSIDEQEMTISMTSGSCASCEWIIGVDEETQKNTVQVDDSGNLVRDKEGNVKFGSAQDRQNDTENYEVWIALKKDVDTFGIIMPNASNNYKPNAGDSFVILHIDLPKAYILDAEKRLEDSLVKYMAMNNEEKFNFSLSFSRIYFAEHPDILEQLDENARIQIEYDNDVYELYVSSYSYYMSNDNILPEVKVELSDTLTINQNALQNAIDAVKQDILSSFGGGDFLKQGLKYFLRKDVNDRSRGFVASDKGFEVGRYKEGELGTGGIFKIDKDGNSYLEVDNALFRKIAYFVEIMIKKLSHVGGSIILSPASMKCSKVEEYETYYRCYFENEKDGKTINQEFVVGDQARSQTFNIKEGLSQNVRNQYYWRLVVGVGSNYIDLSKADCDSGSGIPLAGDDIVQLGNRNNPERQNAIILSSYGEGTPSFRQYKKIHTYSMSDAELVTEFSPENNLITGKFISKSGKDLEETFLEAKVDWDKVLEQTDKEFSMWFFPYAPSADVVPEVDWVTPELKALHEEDLFYDKSTGLAWRYTFEDGSYFWEIVTDAETIKALEKASKAQETADEKIRNFGSQPNPPYDEGDRWCNATYGDLFDNDDLVCVTSKEKGEEFNIEDWRPVSYGKTSIIKNMEGEIKLLADSFELGTVGKYYLSKKAGVNITTEMASLYATKTEYNTLASKVSSNSSQINATANSLSAFTEKISFNSSGDITNISKSGLVTTSNYTSIFSQYKSQTGAVVQSEIRAFVTEDEVGDMISNIEITADKIKLEGVTTINGSFSVDTDGTTHIGGFTVYDGKMTSDGDYKMTIDPVSNNPSISISFADHTYATMRVSNVSPYSGQLELYGAMGAISLLNGGFARFENSLGTEGITIEGDSKLGPFLTIRKGSYYVSIGINSDNMAVIGSNCWPYYDNDTTRKSGVLSWDNSRYGKFK